MSFRLQMLQVARAAPKVLGESTSLVERFLHSQVSKVGGVLDRDGKPDLYYTVFGIEGLLALRAELPATQIQNWLTGFGSGESLDFVHLCCLARCRAAMSQHPPDHEWRAAIAGRLEKYRTPGGGYHPASGRAQGSAYGCLLAAAAYEDIGLPLPDAGQVKACMDALICSAGGWTNEAILPVANAPGTAAAMELYRRHGWPVPESCVHWLAGCHRAGGGFAAIPQAPIPDLLSTAVSLHALSGASMDLTPFREPCLDFVDSLWSAEGGFHGNWTDHALDCEYTYYGLLALGHLA